MENEKIISIIMPTFNSEKTIKEALQSIRNQKFDQRMVEILVIDGGSTDKTLEIAQSFGATILNNEQREPEAAKTLGILNAKGIWGAFLDSDEAFLNIESFKNRISFLGDHKDIYYLATSGILNPGDATGVVCYSNYIGDPFSNFVYHHYNGYNRVATGLKLFKNKKEDEGVIFYFSKEDQLPLYDAKGDFFSISMARECYEEATDKRNVAANLYDRLMNKTHCSAILFEDAIFHDSRMTIKIYASKLKWRVLNNLFGNENGVGFEARKNQESNSKLKLRQFIWILYCVSIIIPFIEGIILAVKNKKIFFVSHLLWNEYIFILIVYYSIRKILNIPPRRKKQYG